ncbi:MAG: lipid-binding SYLF domain-containing protein [Candidatus Ratteibacteria bacterium]
MPIQRRYVIFILSLLLAGPHLFALERSSLVARFERARLYLNDMTKAPDISIPTELLQECKGVMILRQYKAGFMLGAKGGEGIVMVRDETTGKWSPPVFIATAEGSFGFQIGGQSIDAIILIMNRDGLDMLLKSRFKIGLDASAAAGPVGRDVSAKLSAGTALLTYSRAKGLYAGASFEGGFLLIDDKANHTFYEDDSLTPRDILFRNAVEMPQEALPLISILEEYSAPRIPLTGEEE